MLKNNQPLQPEVARNLMQLLMEGRINNEQSSALLTFYLTRPISLSELQSFRTVIIEMQKPLNLSSYDFVDLCGTGGDGKNTINISTLASFVVAAAGYKVAKHGNYGVTSGMGSSNILEKLGYQFKDNQDDIITEIDKYGISFIHAPLFNPAMKNIAPIRRNLGVKTFFNILGPTINPAQPKKQIVGVFNKETQRLYKYLFQQSDSIYTIVNTTDGYDEVSLTSDVKVVNNQGDFLLSPKDFGSERIDERQIHIEPSPKQAIEQFIRILKGKDTDETTRVVAANSALAINLYKPGNLRDITNNCFELIKSGKPAKILQNLIN
jgi:anthranilate phosphoribosyltransferase